METARHTVVIIELFQYRMRIGGQCFRQNALGRRHLAILIDINIVAAMGESAAFSIFPALRVQILQYGPTIGR